MSFHEMNGWTWKIDVEFLGHPRLIFKDWNFKCYSSEVFIFFKAFKFSNFSIGISFYVMFYGLFLLSIWLFCIGKGFINKPLSYVKHHHDSDITKGHHYSDKDSEEGHACG